MTAIEVPPLRFDDPEEHRRRIANAVRRLIDNVRTGRVTFANASTSLTLVIPRLSSTNGHVTLTPTNATAQATTFRATYSNGSVLFEYADPGADATFSYLAVLSGG